jgi:hypothetical protein
MEVPFVYTEAPSRKKPDAERASSTDTPRRTKEKDSRPAEADRRRRPADGQAREARTGEKTSAAAAESLIEAAVKNGDVNAVAEAVETNYRKESIESIR